MNCAKVMRANTTYRCDEEPALVVVVSIDEVGTSCSPGSRRGIVMGVSGDSARAAA
jgi:hypothetical protein